jgi:hypothetical protein
MYWVKQHPPTCVWWVDVAPRVSIPPQPPISSPTASTVRVEGGPFCNKLPRPECLMGTSTECLVGTLCGPKLGSCMNMSRPTAWSATKSSLGFHTGPAPPGRRPESAANRARSCKAPRATRDNRSQPDAATRRLLPGESPEAAQSSTRLCTPPRPSESGRVGAMGSQGRAGLPLPSGVTPCNLMSAQPGPKTSLLAQGFPTCRVPAGPLFQSKGHPGHSRSARGERLGPVGGGPRKSAPASRRSQNRK